MSSACCRRGPERRVRGRRASRIAAISDTWIVPPTSAAVGTKVCAVAPAIATQLLVLESHRYHCRVTEVGLFCHDAAFSVSVWPCCGVPLMKGAALSAGGDGRADPAELMEPLPPAFVAVTCTSVVNPASAEVSV